MTTFAVVGPNIAAQKYKMMKLHITERISAIIVSCTILCSCSSNAQDIMLVNNKTSAYKIVVPKEPSKLEQKSAEALQNYLKLSAGVQLPIVKEDANAGGAAIYIGHTAKGDRMHPAKMAAESYLLQTEGKDLYIMGGSGQGLIYGVYTIAERYAGCLKLSNAPAMVHEQKEIKIPALREEVKPQFEYREVYYPASGDAEYLKWHKLQQFEDLWGLWGHSYDKLVPAKTYFKEHPEYYALVKGKRQPTQLCLSNDAVYKIVVAELKKRMAANPDALYWSVSPNDDIGYCECDKCKPIDDAQGSPSGSLINFVNRVAAAFPDKKITTLAYGYTHRAPKELKPANNVYVFLSDIDAYRDKPLSIEGSAAAFRTDLKAWGTITPNLFVWDYITQFTNYLAPFPNLTTLQPNIQYLKDNGVKGIFAQGSGETYSEFAELRSYLTAELLNNAAADIRKLTTTFLENYYGPKSAKFIQQYIDAMQQKLVESHRKLDIYGNPINEWNSYLSPDNIDLYGQMLDKAEVAAEGNATYLERVIKMRLPLEYTVLQQARFYGRGKFGVFVKENNGWMVRPGLKERVTRFVANCKKAGVTELSEGGVNPDQYQQEWEAIYKAGVIPSKALEGSVALQNPFVEDYPAKGNKTLIDGVPGYNDFSYNWLCFYGVPMVATVDIGQPETVSKIKMHFLDDPRHWIFLPTTVKVEVSEDGVKYTALETQTSPANDEHYELSIKEYNIANTGKGKVRYIRVTAANPGVLPAWRYKDNKKPMIACDEIYVQ